jgi:hypothetical protein
LRYRASAYAEACQDERIDCYVRDSQNDAVEQARGEANPKTAVLQLVRQRRALPQPLRKRGLTFEADAAILILEQIIGRKCLPAFRTILCLNR